MGVSTPEDLGAPVSSSVASEEVRGDSGLTELSLESTVIPGGVAIVDPAEPERERLLEVPLGSSDGFSDGDGGERPPPKEVLAVATEGRLDLLVDSCAEALLQV